MWDAERPDHLSTTFRDWLGGLVARVPRAGAAVRPERQLLQALPARLVGADRGRLGRSTTARAGSASSATAQGYRVESRIPGADVNPYLAFAGIIAAGLHGIEQRLDPGDRLRRQRLRRPRRRPTSRRRSSRRSTCSSSSEVARAAFGDDVHHHLLNTARQEWAAFNRAVTDWELRRNFERI